MVYSNREFGSKKLTVVLGGYSMEQRGTVATCHLLTCGTTLPLVAGVHAGECWLVYTCQLVAGVHSIMWLVTTNASGL